jgi:predicted site-specific integrase-resolvase
MKAPITQKVFEQLPMLLTYGEVIACGVSRRALAAYLQAGTLTATNAPHKIRRRYKKAEIAKILGIE